MPRVTRKAGARSAPARKRVKRLAATKIRKANRHKKPSGLESTVKSWFDEDGIPCKTEFPIGSNPVCHADFLLGKRTVLELHGCHWHAHDLCVKSPLKWQQERRRKDAARYRFFRDQGFDVVVIWECEVAQEPNRVRAMLRAIAANKGK